MFVHVVHTVQETAALLKISSKTVYKLVHDGELNAVRVRGQIRITAQALDEYLKGGNHA